MRLQIALTRAGMSVTVLPRTVLGKEDHWHHGSLLAPGKIIGTLSSLVALPQVQFEDLDSVREALELASRNPDFADALHVTSSRAAERFVTFDRALARRAAGYMSVAPP
jgi:hypothetical protein